MKKIVFTLIIIFAFFGISSVLADSKKMDGDTTGKPWVKNVTLDISALTLNPGETYQLKPIFTPRDTQFPFLSWFSSDPEVAVVQGENNEVAAKKPGNTILMGFTIDKQIMVTCAVKVNGGSSNEPLVESKSAQIIRLTQTDLSKIKDPGLLNFYSFIIDSEQNVYSVETADFPEYKVLVTCDEADKEALLQKAKDIGIENVKSFRYISLLSIQAPANLLAEFLRDETRILTIETDGMMFLQDDREDNYDVISKDMSDYYAKEYAAGQNENSTPPLDNYEKMASETDDKRKSTSAVSTNDQLITKATNLQGSVDVLTNINVMHNAGLKGSGNVVAIIDTGLDASHTEFGSRVVKQSCHSSNGTYVFAICPGDDKTTSSISAYPNATHKDNFNHGSHVAGIAAGNNGIAPGAGIAAVQAFSEIIYNDYYSSTCYWSDIMLAIQDILSWHDNGTNIVAVNMSLGLYDPDNGYAFSTTCDNTSTYMTSLFSQLVQRGILPLVATGNERSCQPGFSKYDNGYCSFQYVPGTIGFPACISYAFPIGALANSSTPQIADFSDHGNLVGLLAPGSYMRSALLIPNNYGYMSGTSMATPAVTGSIALIRGTTIGGDGTHDAAMLKRISTKTVTADSVTKPVLDFTLAPIQTLPLNISAAASNGSVAFSFSQDSTVDGQEVAVATSTDGPWNWACTGGYNTSSCTKTSLLNGATYYYKVRKYLWLDGGPVYGSYSGAQSVVMPKITVSTGLNATPAYGSVTLSASADSTVSGQEFHFSSSSGGPWTWACSGYNSCVKTGLMQGTTYYYKVRKYSWINNNPIYGDFSEIQSFTTLSMSAPSGISALGVDGGLTFYYTADPKVSGHEIVYAASEDGPWNWACSNDTNSTTCTKVGLMNGTKTWFKIHKYIMEYGEPVYSPFSAVYIGYPGEITIPVGLSAVGGDGRITFLFEADASVSGHEIAYSTTKEGPWTWACSGGQNAVTCQKAGLLNGVTYYYKVRKYQWIKNGPVYGAYSSVKSVTTSAITVPSGLSANSSYKMVIFSYTADPNVSGHEVHVGSSSGGPWTWACSGGYNGTSCSKTGLEAGTLYYRIRKYSWVNNAPVYGPYSEVKSVLVKGITVPTGINNENLDSAITFHFDSDSNVSGFEVQFFETPSETAVMTWACSDGAGGTVGCKRTGLENGKTYYYKVRKYILENNAPIYGPFNSGFLIAVPLPVPQVTAIADDGHIRFNFNKNTAKYGLKIYQKNTNDQESTLVCNIGVSDQTTNTCSTEGLTSGGLYDWSAVYYKTVDGVDYEGPIQNPRSVVPNQTVLSIRSEITASTGVTTFTWEKPADITGVQVYGSSVVTGPYALLCESTASSCTTSKVSVNSVMYILSMGYKLINSQYYFSQPVAFTTNSDTLTGKNAFVLESFDDLAEVEILYSMPLSEIAQSPFDFVETDPISLQKAVPEQPVEETAEIEAKSGSGKNLTNSALLLFYRLDLPFWRDDSLHSLPGTGFPSGHLTQLRLKPAGLDYGATGMQIEIPGLDVSAKIVTIPETDGSYPVDWLDGDAGLLEGSYLPGEGVSLLTGHNHLNTMEIGPFLFIRDLASGDRIYVTKADGELLGYKVYENLLIPADAADEIPSHLKQNALVLITCEDESSEGGYLNRRVVLAEPL